MNGEFRYEVAFSFLQDDEQLALEIANRLRDRVSIGVFVYSERQDELVGTDGVDSFSKVFGEESRIVVILYCGGWGQTSWTRTEENAIRARGFNEGHEFVLLVKLDQTKPPVWLPPTRIYLGFERYGIDGVASAIESRVQSLGGAVKNETVLDRASIVSREIDFRNERSQWRQSGLSIEAAKEQTKLLFQDLKKFAEQISSKNPQMRLEFSQPPAQISCEVYSRGNGFSVSWFMYNADYFDQAGLTFTTWERGRFIEGRSVRSRRETDSKDYNVDLDLSRRVGWREENGNRFFTSSQLAEHWIKWLLDKAYEDSVARK